MLLLVCEIEKLEVRRRHNSFEVILVFFQDFNLDFPGLIMAILRDHKQLPSCKLIGKFVYKPITYLLLGI